MIPDTCKELFDSINLGVMGMGPCAGGTENWCPDSCPVVHAAIPTVCSAGDVYGKEDAEDADGNAVLD